MFCELGQSPLEITCEFGRMKKEEGRTNQEHGSPFVLHASFILPNMLYDCDVLVVGGGAGGATLAYACARAGKSVLLLERGRTHQPEDATLNERTSLIDKKP